MAGNGGIKRFFRVMGREEAETYRLGEPHAVISISDVDRCDVEMPENEFRQGVLRLKFRDFDLGTIEDVFQVDMARTILDFVERQDVETIICQCEAGISRSAGVAAALSKIYNGHDSAYFTMYIPNRRVYSLILAEFFERERHV